MHAATLTHDSYHRIAATGGSVSVSTESEQSAGQGYPPTWQVRRHDIPVSLSMDTSVWWSSDLFSAMRTTLGADRSREHLEAHAKGETVTSVHLRAEQVVDWATRGGARALGRDDLGRLAPGAKADVVLIKNDASPVSFPLLNPYGHVAFQAQRGDVHTVLVDGRVVKSEHRLVGADLPAVRRAVEQTVEHLRSSLGEQAWVDGMHPALPDDDDDDKVLDNPYPYTEYRSESPAAPGAASSASPADRPDDQEDERAWQDAGRDPTSSRRSHAGSTSWPASTPSTGPGRSATSRRRPGSPVRRPGGCC